MGVALRLGVRVACVRGGVRDVLAPEAPVRSSSQSRARSSSSGFSGEAQTRAATRVVTVVVGAGIPALSMLPQSTPLRPSICVKGRVRCCQKP